MEYNDRYSRGRYAGSERDLFDRMADEMRSWFGDEAAEQRRRMDERRNPNTWHLGEHDRIDRLSRGRVDAYERDELGPREFGSPTSAGGYAGYYGYGRGDFARPRGGATYRDNDYDFDRARDYGRYESAYGGSSTPTAYGWRGRGEAGYGRDWDEERSHYGKGPKNWKRSPDRIHDQVCERLSDDHTLDASNIDVKCEQNGELTLSGEVDSFLQKRRAEDIAYNMSGIRHVQNNLRIKQQQGQSVPIESEKRTQRRGAA